MIVKVSDFLIDYIAFYYQSKRIINLQLRDFCGI